MLPPTPFNTFGQRGHVRLTTNGATSMSRSHQRLAVALGRGGGVLGAGLFASPSLRHRHGEDVNRNLIEGYADVVVGALVLHPEASWR